MRRGDIPRTEMKRHRGWIGSLGKARKALATATANLGDMVDSDIAEVDRAVSQALDLIEQADESLVDALSHTAWAEDSEYDAYAAENPG